MARRLPWLLLGVVVLYFLFDLAMVKGWFIPMPRGRDARLVGRWSGTAGGRPKRFVFHEDGTGEIWQPKAQRDRPFEWGTEGGRLFAKVVMTDAWGRLDYPYSVSADDRILRIGVRHDSIYGAFLGTLRRAP